MIRINLLREDGRRVVHKPAGPGFSAANPLLLFVASAALSVAALGLVWWTWSHEINKLNQEMAKARAEQTRLAAIAAENRRYQLQVRMLEDRIKTIELLEASRTGPVQFMGTLGQTVNQASGLYLMTVGPEGDHFRLKGMADSVNAIAGFIAALKQASNFGDVQLREYFQDDQTDRVSFKFDLVCQYRAPGMATAATAPLPAPAAATPGPAFPSRAPAAGPAGK